MPVFYNSRSGNYSVANQSLDPAAEALFLSFEAQLHTGTGWHEYATIAAMNAAVAANHWPTPFHTNNPFSAVNQSVATGLPNAASQAAKAAGVPQGVTQFFANISASSTWLRVAKVVLGGTLIIIALAQATNTDKALYRAAKTAVLL